MRVQLLSHDSAEESTRPASPPGPPHRSRSSPPGPCCPRLSALRRWGPAPLPPGPIQELHLCQPLGDHGGKHQAKEDAADQHVVIVVLQDVKLLGWVDSSLVNVQTIGHNLEGGGNEKYMREAASGPPGPRALDRKDMEFHQLLPEHELKGRRCAR